MTPHYQDDEVTIHRLKCGPYDNNAYLVVCPKTNESILIDTPQDPEELIEAAKATKVQSLVITHNHFDHIEGFTQVTSAIDARVGIAEADAHALPKAPDFLLEDGGEIRAGTVALKLLSTPGHTPGSTCLLMGNHLFSGDTLFPGGPGRTGTPENFEQIIASITGKLFALDDSVAFYPGHGGDGDLKTAKEEYGVFKSRQHPAGLCGDVLWLEN